MTLSFLGSRKRNLKWEIRVYEADKAIWQLKAEENKAKRQ